MTSEPKRLIETITEHGKIEHYESLAIQTIISFKWTQYTRGFFLFQFYMFIAFFFAFIADIYYSLINKKANEDNIADKDERIGAITLSLKGLCLGFLLYFT
jgi:hypothetical protein